MSCCFTEGAKTKAKVNRHLRPREEVLDTNILHTCPTLVLFFWGLHPPGSPSLGGLNRGQSLALLAKAGPASSGSSLLRSGDLTRQQDV